MAVKSFEPITRAVQIWGSSYGSGYRIGERLVLTAAHLTEGVGSTCTVAGRITETDPGWHGKASCVWIPADWEDNASDAGLDVALLELSEEIEGMEAAMLGQLPQDRGGTSLQFDMYGWPEWAQTRDDSGSAPEAGGRHVPGTVYLADQSPDGNLVLEPTVNRLPGAPPPGEGSAWEGFSGAAIVCDGLVVAVQHRHQRPDRPGSLEASLLAKCFQDEDFLNLLKKHDIPHRFPLASVSDGRAGRYRDRLDNLLGRHELFGGREAEMQRLNAFVANGDGGYLFVTGYSGYGKTALLANWVVRELKDTDHLVCYQFVSRAEDTAGKDFTLRNLCQQLIELHQKNVPLPSTLDDLQQEVNKLLSSSPVDGSKLVVVIDGLDETEDWEFRPNLLPKKPAKYVYVVFSARKIAEKDWLDELNLPANMPIIELTKLGTAEIAQLLKKIEGPSAEWLGDPGIVNTIHERSQGDPFYLHYLVVDIQNEQIKGQADLKNLPKGLDAYLKAWWRQIKGEASVATVKDLLGYLLVAKGPIPEGDLVEISDDDELDGLTLQDPIDRINRFVIGNSIDGYSISHWRFQDFMVRGPFKGSVRNKYRRRMLAYCERWREHESQYALRYIASHLADDVREADESERHQRTERLVRLVTDSAFQDVHSRQLDDPAALQRDVEQALDMAIDDDDEQALPLVVETALALVEFRRNRLRPDPLFEEDQLDRLENVEHRLDLFAIEPKWRQAVQLTLAWLATEQHPGAARALRDRVVGAGPLEDPLPQLLAHVDAALAGADAPEPVTSLPPVPEPPEMAFNAILERLGGGQGSSYISEGVFENLGPDRESVTDFAEEDAPLLVAYAHHSPAEGTQRFIEYISLHAGNSYIQYRNESLWIVLKAMLRHPSAAWIRSNLLVLETAALGGSRLDFLECTPIMLRAIEARAGNADALVELESWSDQAVQDANHLIGFNGIREFGDTWGSHKRRLTALAVAFALLDRQSDSEVLLNLAETVPIGYAGFQAPACLSLAQGIHIVRPLDDHSVQGAIEAALRAAHNIQDQTFCARTTARVEAMRQRWWHSPLPDDLGSIVDRLIANSNAPEFAALHVVHEWYVHRVFKAEGTPMMPDDYMLWHLENHYKRPLSEFHRLNPGLDLDPTAVLEQGAVINVPDPEFPALLAARLAAEALVDPTLADDRVRAEIIASLVPLTTRDPTSLDAVLGYLLWAARPGDQAMLTSLRTVIERYSEGIFAEVTPPLPG